MKLSTGNYKRSVAIAVIALLSSFATESLKAQSITTAPDGTNTVILQNGQRFDITGGTQAGANLFHSFQQFGLSQGQIANFLSNPSIQNILGRVVGGDPSVINGLIQLTGGNSNLYIMNPAGIIFGGNASLNVPAAFTATTASGIQVGNGWFGMNTSAADLKNLTGNPTGFAFTNPSTTTPATGQTGVILNQGNLTATQGQSITLVGGIVINTGTITTPNGKINIVASADGKYVRVTPEGGVLSLDLPVSTQQELGTRPITGVDLPKLLTGTGITAPTKVGEIVVKGQLTAANIDILANRYNTTQASLNAANIQQGWNLVFVDSTVKNYQTLVDGTKGGSSVTVIGANQYGINKITTTLADITGANSLHIVSEGDAGNFWLGKDFVSSENIGNYSTQLQAWRTALSPAANILLYACNLASGENGVALVQAVKNYTGRDVAASTDRTGATSLGGNWNLEYQTGTNPATVIFNEAATNAYKNALAVFTATNANDAGVGSLRAQVIAANAALGADEIRFSFSGTPIVLTTGEIVITDALTVSGNGRTNTIIDGNANSRIFNITAAVPVTIDGVTIRNGREVISVGLFGGGGGILSYGSFLTINNSNVSGNTAASGGGIYSGGTLTINNSNVSGNTVTNSSGGGIYSYVSLTINNSTVSGNTARSGGGGIDSDGTLTLSNSNVSGNTTSFGGGGGINVFNANNRSLTIINSSTVSGNTAYFGGGIFGNGTVILTNSTVSGNAAIGGSGGGIDSGGTVTINNSTVSGNTATDGGGGISIFGALTLNNSNVSGNTAGSRGGGINSFGGINTSGTVSPYNINSGGTVTLNNSTVSGNTTRSDGGGIFSFKNVVVTLTNSTVWGNTAIYGRGGGIYGRDATLINSTVSSNTSYGDGGGIFSEVARGFLRNGSVILKNSTVSDNFSDSNGGGIFGFGTLTLNNSTVSGNRSDNAGGGIYVSTNGILNLNNSTVSGNTANTNGGGIFTGSRVGGTIASSTITNNTADVNKNGTGDGGGIYTTTSGISIINSIVAGNFDTSNPLLGKINPDVNGRMIDRGNNLIGINTGSRSFSVSTLVGTTSNPIDPKLAPLANNGGTTQTHALLQGSPAIDAGNNTGVAATDQRGSTRIVGGKVDIGAFESQGFNLRLTTNSVITFTPSAILSSGDGNALTNKLGISTK
jgi:filamentous hemagglutinin family protein